VTGLDLGKLVRIVMRAGAEPKQHESRGECARDAAYDVSLEASLA